MVIEMFLVDNSFLELRNRYQLVIKQKTNKYYKELYN